MELTWLSGPSVEALRVALRTVAPGLAEAVIVPRGLEPSEDPRWCAASAVVDERFVVKFAWSEVAARRVCYQAEILEALRKAAPRLPLPSVVLASRDPALLVTRRAAAVPFFDVRHLIGPADRPAVARDLAGALAELHAPEVLRAVGPLPAPLLPAGTTTLRAGFGEVVDAGRRDRIVSWCDRADLVLARPGRSVLVHGDFHGDNHLWDRAALRLRLVIDVESAGVGEPEFDLRCLPGDCGVDLFRSVVAAYEELTGTSLDVPRVMAWHVRTVLDDVLWRTSAGVPLPDRRTPAEWVDDLGRRLIEVGNWPEQRPDWWA